MECTGAPMDIPDFSNDKNAPTIEKAGQMVGLDLKHPIDCSQMRIVDISDDLDRDKHDSSIEVIRRTVLHTYVINDYGEREELEITFKLKSKRRAKFVTD